jgi:hypothetical protein
VAAAVPIPVIGNGDLLFPHEFDEHLRASGCAALMSARGVLIKPWLFRELSRGYWDITAEERVGVDRRYVEFAAHHWGRRPSMSVEEPSGDDAAPPEPVARQDDRQSPRTLDEHGRERVRDFLRWHVGFWVRYAPRHPDGTWPTMQRRESAFEPRSPLEALLSRHDDAAVDYITDQLIDGGDLSSPPPPSATESEPAVTAAG